MGTRYLYPPQRRLEVIGAMYATGLGAWVGMGVYWSHGSPLSWTGWPVDTQAQFALVMVMSSVLWALGVRINGRWRCSPALRALGMTVQSVAVATAALAGGGSTATYTYTCIATVLALGAANAARDTRAAWGDGWTMQH